MNHTQQKSTSRLRSFIGSILSAALLAGVLVLTTTHVLCSRAFALPATITGVANMFCIHPGSGIEDTGIFEITMPDEQVLRGTCLDAGLPAPAHGPYAFTATWNGTSYDVVMHTQTASPLPGQIDIGKGCQRIGGFTWIPRGSIELKKTSSSPTLTENNACYSLENAHYGVYPSESDAQNDTNCITVLKTDATGLALSETLPFGTYYVKETVAPQGMALDENAPYRVEVESYEPTRVNKEQGGVVKDTPQGNPARVILIKHDSEQEACMSNTAQGAASLAFARYQFQYYDGYYETVAEAEASGSATSTWIFQTDEYGIVDLSTKENTFTDAQGTIHPYLLPPDQGGTEDELFTTSDGDIIFPLGTLIIHEIAAPIGYILPDPAPYFVRHITPEGTTCTVSTYQAPMDSDQLIRGDIELIKVAEDTMERLARIPFKITSQTTGESHILFTDMNGYASTASSFNPHSYATNSNDTLPSNAYDPCAGIWFGMTQNAQATTPDDNQGALPYDVYDIEEMPCSANRGMRLISIHNISVTRPSCLINLGTIDDPRISLSTRAFDASDGDNALDTRVDATLIDEVSYSNLTPGQSYTLKGCLMNKETGEPLSTDGTPIQARLTFEPTTPHGSVEVVFTFDTRALSNTAIVIFESLECDGIEVASHADLNASSQTVTVVPPPDEPPPTTPPTPPTHNPPYDKTGASVFGIAFVSIALLLVGSSLFAVAVRKRRQNKLPSFFYMHKKW